MTEGEMSIPSYGEFLPAWLAKQRWYAGKGRLPQLRRIGGLRLDDPAGQVRIDVHFVLDCADGARTVYQIPLTDRGAPLPGGQHALVATTTHAALGARYIYDGPHDPVYAAQLVATMVGHDIGVTGSRVLSGEQSNTSIICETTSRNGASMPLICKIFRVLHHGSNPDVVIQSALAAAGCDRVPESIGSLVGTWPDATVEGGRARGHLAFAQAFLPGTQDAWRVAARALAGRTDFTVEACALGAATAQVHATLASALPTRQATDDDRRKLVQSWRARFVSAVSEVPALAVHQATIRALYDRAAVATWPTLQRVHGDYHLGQVLDVPNRGWVLIDFEGEPMRPLAERAEPDLTLRDVAGMLRSFEYAAGAHTLSHPDDASRAAEWAVACRTAFLDGYASAGPDPRDYADLLAALELDKALYEIVYEARNRPAWLPIARQGVERVIASGKARR